MKDSKILIIEDETITALELKKNMKQWGYPDPEVVISGEEALEKIEKIDPDLLLVDIKLPGEMSGIKTVQEIKKIKDIPVIYITSFQDKETVKKVSNTNPFSYHLKPLDLSELRINMELALEKYRQNKKADPEMELDRYRDIYQFISTIILPLTSQMPIYKRNQYLIGFSKRFEEIYSFEFKKSIKNDLKANGNIQKNTEIKINSYLLHLVHLLGDLGFNFQETQNVSEKYLLSSHCPWKMEESPNNFLCLICQLIMKNTMKWADIKGNVLPQSSITNGYKNCIFEFKFQENK